MDFKRDVRCKVGEEGQVDCVPPNTFNSGAIRYTTDGDKWTMELCPDNNLTKCNQIRP